MKAESWKKSKPYRAQGRVDPERQLFLMLPGKGAQNFINQNSGARRKYSGNEKLFSSAELHEIFSIY